MGSEKLSLKLLIDNSANRVIFAEAGKDFVDFLFSLLALSVGSAIKLLSKNNSRFEGSIATLFNSVQNLNQTYIRTGLDKSALLNLITPSLSSTTKTPPPLLLLEDKTHETAPAVASSSTKYYLCGRKHSVSHCSSARDCGFYVSNVRGATCPYCKVSMTEEATYVDGGKGKEEEEGYVKGVVTYMVMDDLEVNPLSTISCFSLLSKFNVQDVKALQEKVVKVGMKEGLALLKASLQSKTALTDVFLSSNQQSGQRSSRRRLR